jgi:hypothetical protein
VVPQIDPPIAEGQDEQAIAQRDQDERAGGDPFDDRGDAGQIEEIAEEQGDERPGYQCPGLMPAEGPSNNFPASAPPMVWTAVGMQLIATQPPLLILFISSRST